MIFLVSTFSLMTQIRLGHCYNRLLDSRGFDGGQLALPLGTSFRHIYIYT